MVQISQSSAQVQSYNILARGYYLKSWVWIGEEHDPSFLLFCSPPKATWGHSRPPSSCTEPLSQADCNAEMTACCGQGQRGQLGGARACQISESTALLALQSKRKQCCFCSPGVLQRGSSVKVIIKKSLRERGSVLCVA